MNNISSYVPNNSQTQQQREQLDRNMLPKSEIQLFIVTVGSPSNRNENLIFILSGIHKLNSRSPCQKRNGREERGGREAAGGGVLSSFCCESQVGLR